jgi:ribonuclease Y
MDPLVNGLAVAVALLFGAVAYVGRGLVERSRQKKAVAAAADEASRILARAGEEADNLRTSRVLEGKEEVIRLREAWEREEAKHRDEVERAEGRITERSTALDRRFDNLNERESAQEKRAKEVEAGTEELTAQTRDLEQDRERVRSRLESLAGMSQSEARKELLEELQAEARAEAANTLREVKEEAHRTADGEA